MCNYFPKEQKTKMNKSKPLIHILRYCILHQNMYNDFYTLKNHSVSSRVNRMVIAEEALLVKRKLLKATIILN